MDEVGLITTVQSYLDSQLSAPVRTRGGTEDERPVPVVVLEDYDINDEVYHNSHLAQVVENDSAGTPDTRYHQFYYWIRLDYLVRNTDDVATTELYRDLKNAFRPLTENPQALDDDIHNVKLRGGGGFGLTNVEDAETESNFAVRIRTFHQMDNSDSNAFGSSTLDEIQNNLDEGYGNDFTVTN